MGCMRAALIADTFPPIRSSGAVQLRDLSREFARQGHRLTVMLPCSDLDGAWSLQELDGVEVLRLRAPRTKEIDYLRRTLGEFLMPFYMLNNLGVVRLLKCCGTGWCGMPHPFSMALWWVH